jgi:ElaB/YqjD/DUF883 family membrane-anchored ribosome-binding protein
MADTGQKRLPSDPPERKAEDYDADTTSDSMSEAISKVDSGSVVESMHTSADMARLQQELAGLKSTVVSLIAEVKGGAAKTLRAAGDLVSHKVESAGHVAVEKSSALAESTTERAQNVASELEIWARRRPLSAIAGAMLAGILIGMLGRRRR